MDEEGIMTAEETAEAATQSELGMDPMLKKTFREIMTDCGKRALLLVSKVFSVKIGAASLVTYLYVRPDVVVPFWGVVVMWGMAIFGREFLKVAKDFIR